MTTNTQSIQINFKEYLSEIYDKPQKLHEAYRYFHRFSFLNSIRAEGQLVRPEPINTFQGWLKLGRQVKKGSKAISLMLPVFYKNKDEEKDQIKPVKTFILKRHWFSYSQTQSVNDAENGEVEAKESDFVDLPNFDLEKALKTLNVTQKPFQMIDGNCQGYAIPSKQIIAINPMAYAPYKTTIHEIAHCLLHKDEEGQIIDGSNLERSVKEFEAETTAYLVCCALGKFDHLEYSRGYIAGWIKQEEVLEVNFKRAFEAANQILKAGEVVENKN
jgi:antirestriction protein ArdC